MKNKPLTPKQKEVINFICMYRIREGMPPTRQEIQRHMEFKSVNSVTEILNRLSKAGVIKIKSGTARGIKILV